MAAGLKRASTSTRGGGALVVVAFLVLISPARALEQTLVAGDGAAGDRLGTSVAIDGDTVVVGAPGDDQQRGAVYVFERSGDSWINTAKLLASDGVGPNPGGFQGDNLGASVAIDGDTIVAGAPKDRIGDTESQGSAYTFARTGPAVRVETAKLTSSDGASIDNFGSAVAIDGDTIVVGAFGVPAGASEGAVYTFARTGDPERTETAKLTITSAAGGDGLGGSVAIDGDTIVAGAFRDDGPNQSEQGAVYTFARTGAAERTETARMTASDGGFFDLLGSSVAIDGDTIVAGAVNHEFSENGNEGAVYTFTRTGAAERTETAQLAASDQAVNDGLGAAVGIDGEMIVAGAPRVEVEPNTDPGSAYTFARTGAAMRTETAFLTATGGLPGDNLGSSIAIEGDTIVAGAPGDVGSLNDDKGSATVFFAPDVTCRGKSATIVGSAKGETLDGTPSNDVIAALGGQDTVTAGGGNDTVCGGAGADDLAGQGGKDSLFGEGGGDSVAGGGGAGDLCQGGKGRDEAGGGCERTKAIP